MARTLPSFYNMKKQYTYLLEFYENLHEIVTGRRFNQILAVKMVGCHTELGHQKEYGSLVSIKEITLDDLKSLNADFNNAPLEIFSGYHLHQDFFEPAFVDLSPYLRDVRARKTLEAFVGSANKFCTEPPVYATITKSRHLDQKNPGGFTAMTLLVSSKDLVFERLTRDNSPIFLCRSKPKN